MATVKEVVIPDIGTTDPVDVIELFVAVGDAVEMEDSLITLESDKATMEVPAPFAGVVEELKVAVGDKVSEGSVILMLRVEGDEASADSEQPAKQSDVSTEETPKQPTPPKEQAPTKPAEPKAAATQDVSPVSGKVYAGPAVRRLARELGVNLNNLTGTGRKNRITREDIYAHVKGVMTQGPAGSAGSGLNLIAPPKVDFSKYGEVEVQPLSKIKKISGANLHRNWVTIPHVTQFDEADITNMETFRQSAKAEAEKQGFKLTPLVFIMKAVVGCLKEFPEFNASLDESGENLILKKYYHLGIAVDTPNGLVVPVVRDVDRKGIFELAQELGEISQQAREKGLTPAQMQGGCFAISSLGGISGTAFTPIINAPDVAILGVSKSTYKPIYNNGEFEPKLMLPLSLSYDHRVIDGAQAARFTRHLTIMLGDIRRLLL